ncbi:YggS family pyridoxal phosphate-dependent enzyme [Psychromicrobium sp. YIM B11713]|uniref:YggS family pyridoxal phosphate-dependent enzyme n=1 Tax=Psychromicrobium sp. YIM B11713 TaxID=3145233 RepID=UPI00374EF3BD
MNEMAEIAERRAQLTSRLTELRKRIERAVSAAHRSQAPELIVVTKFHPASDVLLLAELGVTQVGENRDQEAAAKSAEVRAHGISLYWNFIGQLQSNKAKSVAAYASAVHSIDRPSLVDALAKAVQGTEREALRCFVQLDLAENPGGPRGGAQPADLLPLAERIASAPGLELAGVMAVAPLGEAGRSADPEAAFARLAQLSSTLLREHPEARAISAGMSADLEQAIAYGATHLRVGSDVLGARAAVR